MKEKIKFYQCPVCGNIIEVVDGDVSRVKCCNQPLTLIEANTEDASLEKHVPVYEVNGDEITVKVGSVIHPMDESHYIMWIMQVTDERVCRVELKPNQEPIAKFAYVKGATVYAYCNLHGLWKTEIE